MLNRLVLCPPNYSAPPSNPAALPWYNFAATRQALDAVWRETRAQLRAIGIDQSPTHLDHVSDANDLLKYPALTLSQCCGLDLYQATTDRVVPFAVPVITALEVAEGYYFSHIAARSAAKLQTPRVVINSRFSHSGHTALKIWLRANHYDDYTLFESGSHAQSVTALQRGQADLAAIDALSWRHLDTKGLQILDRSEPAPAPPFIRGEHSSIPADALTAALNAGFERYGQPIGISGVLPVSRHEYSQLADQAIRYGE